MDSCKADLPPSSALPILTLRNDKTLEYYDVLRKQTHLITRAGFNGDLEIQGDTTISRSHAKFSLFKIAVGNSVSIHLKLMDNNSKFGTFVNDGIETNERISNDHFISLKLGDRIRFGRLDSTWTVIKYPIVVCPSTLKMADKEILKRSMSAFGGRVTRDWSDQCTHLCMQTITVTEKVLTCLASAKSIVLPKYFTVLSKALSPGSLTELPFCEDYEPVLAENLLNPNLVSMKVNNKRKTLFFGKIFICSSMEQLNRVSKIVKAASGRTLNYSDGILSDDEILNNDKYILMKKDPINTESYNKTYQLILENLESMSKRSIPENDIGLAIIFSSTVKYCNPDYNTFLVNLQPQESNITETEQPESLVFETEIANVVNSSMSSINVIPDSHPEIQGASINVIPDSYPEIQSTSINVIPDSHPITQCAFKRPLEVEEIKDSNEFVLPQKRALLSNNQRESNNSEKIKIDEDLEPSHKIELNLSLADCTVKFSASIEPVVLPNIVDSCVTTVADSQNVTNKNSYPVWFQTNVTNNNDNCNTQNFHSKSVENEVITKRKISNVSLSINNNDNDDDPFDYMDIDEIEEQPKKKPKKEHTMFFPETTTASTNISEHQNTAEPEAVSEHRNTAEPKAVDPNFIMNLLSMAKGTGEFIDASKPSNNLSVNERNGNNLENSVIVETVKLVVSKPKQSATHGYVQKNNSHLQNFKKFKRKGPAVRIPHIVPLKLY